MNSDKRHQLILSWLKEAATYIKEALEKEWSIDTKNNRKDLVTDIDRETERFLCSKIRENFPGEIILAEEGYGDSVAALKGIVWFIDPIDGTMNFIKQKRNFAIMLAVYVEGTGKMGYIYDVMADELYWTIRGKGVFCNQTLLQPPANSILTEGLIALSNGFLNHYPQEAHALIQESLGLRITGSAGLEFVNVLSGRLAAYLSHSLSPWDMAAGKVLAEEYGLSCTSLGGEALSLLQPSSVLVASPSVYQHIRQMHLTK